MFTEILLLNPVYITLFWAIILNLYPRKGNEPKRFLGRFMIVAFVVYLSHFFFFLELHNLYIWIDSFYYFASLAVFPLYYIYVLLLIRDRRFSWKLHGRYLIAPAAMFVLVAVGYIRMDDETQLNYVSLVQHGISYVGKGIRYMETISLMTKIVFISQVVIYVILSYKLTSKHNREISDYYSNLESRRLGWVQVFNLLLFLVSVSSSVVALIGRENFQGNNLYLLFPSLVFSVLLFWVGYLGNTQKAVHTEFHNVAVLHPSEEKIPDRLREELLNLFEEKKYYLNKDLKIWDVSGHLATNRTYVSRIINHEFGQNFCSFVNSFRIKHAKELLSSKKNHSIEEIADLSGFGSVNSLYRAFISVEKIPLKEYRNSHRRTTVGS
ncbi:MAG: AraC family transcriptional regulator [Bacteroidia bacterium]|nr:MAG: AraC family transcriptional regulator [Bacteroidia bacterium]